ncbi:phd finger protein 20-like protein 1 isoform x4 [Limosa lapponica baueri]|uniref:Phd finger protein 20-like protein 1 isoform x4 n=1 Tax=Limosa lapponica baueri TaxID=1758121 RepID=A0A2I0TGX0_LIMLA|nr:phd finger protein 20-like protein 1 isoform x4 [Limosa lapponica baueri]
MASLLETPLAMCPMPPDGNPPQSQSCSGVDSSGWASWLDTKSEASLEELWERSRCACAILVAFPAGFKLMFWTNSTARERKRHRQPWYPVEDHNTLEAEWFYSLDALQHCIKIKDLNVAYKAIEDRDQNSDGMDRFLEGYASTDPMAKYQETSSEKENTKMSKKPPNRPGITFEIGARLEALDYLQKCLKACKRICFVFSYHTS